MHSVMGDTRLNLNATFWTKENELFFTGVDGLSIGYVKVCNPINNRVMIICPGRAESYFKYVDVVHVFLSNGYDVIIIDHRGQGVSERMLKDSEKGHVETFSDYIADFSILWHKEIENGKWEMKFILGNSMGGAISTLFLHENRVSCDAVVLCAPMFGIIYPVAESLAKFVLKIAMLHPFFAESYAITTGPWKAIPFRRNKLTQCRTRYKRIICMFENNPHLRIGGPTYRWVNEAVIACRRITLDIDKDRTPTLLIQAEMDDVVDNKAQDTFCERRKMAGSPCEGETPLVIRGAYHDLLSEVEPIRGTVILHILRYFNEFTSAVPEKIQKSAEV